LYEEQAKVTTIKTTPNTVVLMPLMSGFRIERRLRVVNAAEC